MSLMPAAAFLKVQKCLICAFVLYVFFHMPERVFFEAGYLSLTYAYRLCDLHLRFALVKTQGENALFAL